MANNQTPPHGQGETQRQRHAGVERGRQRATTVVPSTRGRSNVDKTLNRKRGGGQA